MRLRRFWPTSTARVLGLERVGVDESFFRPGRGQPFGGALVTAVNSSLDADVSVAAVFDAPTVAQLAPRVGAGGGGWSRWWR